MARKRSTHENALMGNSNERKKARFDNHARDNLTHPGLHPNQMLPKIL